MPREKDPDSKSPDEEEDYDTAKAKHLVKEYKCYSCGKTEIGKNLDGLYKNNIEDSWYFEFSEGFDVYPQILILPLPQTGISIKRSYCNKCGKTRERELELFRIEHRKMKALEGIGSALESIAKGMSNPEVAEALESIAMSISASSIK